MQTDKDQFELRFEIIKNMPDGPEKEAAMQQLFTDYPGLAAQAQDKINKGFALATQESPQGGNASPGNPYSVYVAASPLEHAAVGAQRYMGFKQMGESRDKQAELSAQKEAGLNALGSAALQQGQAAALRSPDAAGGPPPGMSPDEWEQYLRWKRMQGPIGRA